LALVVLREGSAVTPDDLQAFLATRVARWWVPERWAFVGEIPKTSVGKFNKKVVRAMYAEGKLPVTELASKR
jgi:fatty-acyl-CoA synthase